VENKHIYPVTEMRKAILDCYELPMDTDLYEHFGDTLKALPAFKFNFKGFDDPKEVKNCWIRYINYLYSPHLTCIEKAHPDEAVRKTEVAALSGFKFKEDGKFDKKIENLLAGKAEGPNQMIWELLKISGSDDFATIAWLRDLYYKAQQKQNTLDGLELDRILKAKAKLDTLKKEYLRGDTSVALSESLIKRIEAENLGFSPESIADNISQGKNPLGLKIVDVYG
jgi:hypothetical protein